MIGIGVSFVSKGGSNPVVGVEMGGKVHSNISSSSEGRIRVVLCLRWLQWSESLIQHKVSSQGRDYNAAMLSRHSCTCKIV